MKRIFLGVFAFLVIYSCSENDKIQDEPVQVDMSDFYLYTDSDVDEMSRSSVDQLSKSCYTMVNLNRLLNENPGLYQRMYNVERHSRTVIAAKKPDGVGGGNGGGGGSTDPDPEPEDPINDGLGILNIPVYVHIVMPDPNSVSSTQVDSQIAVLNNDFRRQNNDANETPSEFASVAADSEINFTLAGTFRRTDSRATWGTSDAVKLAYPPVTPETHMNVWVCVIGNNILGYAQFPGGPAATDGIVVDPRFFGTTSNTLAPFDEGRTATHEVGHYLNLRHIWGDGRCNRDDFVADTPTSDSPNYGCPTSTVVKCRSNDQYMNYMDYTNDGCMNMFSLGQKERMRAIFESGGPRAAMAN